MKQLPRTKLLLEYSEGTVMEIPQELVPAVRRLLAERGG